MKYDVTWYWRGGSEVGTWHAAPAGSEAELERMGFVALPGLRSIGAPEGPPSADRLRAALTANLPDGMRRKEA